MKNLSNEGRNELINVVIDVLQDRGEGLNTSDLHNECFNTDYFIIGYYQAEEWLKNNYGIFAAIDTIKEYEENNFGEVTTDLSSSEKVVNMLVYILGEEIINDLSTISDNWDEEITPKLNKKIIKELKSL
jgi:hypothetical protein